MNDAELHDLAGAYVLDALDPEERATFELHLAGCSECQAETAELSRVVDVLPLAAEPVEPSAGLRDRIVAEASSEMNERPRLTAIPGGAAHRAARTGWGRAEWMVAAAAAVVILGLGVYNLSLQQRVHSYQAQVAFQQKFAIALSTGASVLPVAPTTAAPGALAAIVQPPKGAHAYLLVQGLPASASHKVYQVWLIRGTQPVSAGVFTYQGSDTVKVPLALPVSGYALTALTDEPGPRGSSGPTGRKFLLSRLGA